MKINILTIFPEIFTGWMQTGMIKQALDKNIITINIIDIRQYSQNKHHKVDDYPYGGFAGMLMMVQPIDDAIIKNNLQNTHLIFPSPKGKVLDQNKLEQLTQYKELTLLAGRYEGIDQRVIDMHVDEMISLGDYILTGGELAIATILDGMIRLLPGVLNNDESTTYESFYHDLLEFPQYTRPYEYKGLQVPNVLVNGNHQLIKDWCYKQQLLETKKYRNDLYQKYLQKNNIKEIDEPDN